MTYPQELRDRAEALIAQLRKPGSAHGTISDEDASATADMLQVLLDADTRHETAKLPEVSHA